MARFTVWTNTIGDPLRFYIMGTFSGLTETEALDKAAQDPGEFGRRGERGWEGYESFDARNLALGFTRDNYKVRKVA